MTEPESIRYEFDDYNRNAPVVLAVFSLIFPGIVIPAYWNKPSMLFVALMVFIPLTIFCAVLAYRAWRACVTVNSAGIRIQNIFKRYDLKWSDVQTFEFGTLPPNNAIGIVRLRNGKRIGMSVMQARNTKKGDALQKVQIAKIDQLNSALERHRLTED